jgi:hypothetical protein
MTTLEKAPQQHFAKTAFFIYVYYFSSNILVVINLIPSLVAIDFIDLVKQLGNANIYLLWDENI